MEKKERKITICLYVVAISLLRAMNKIGENVRESDIPNIINKVYDAADYKGNEIERQRMFDMVLLQYKRLLAHPNSERKEYIVSNRDHLPLAIFDTLNEARDFVSDYRAALNLKLPNDVRINVKYAY